MPHTIAIVALALAVGAGCAATQSTGKAEIQGFLRDYSRLEQGGEGQVQRRWIDPDANFAAYNAVMIDPVSIRSATDETKESVPEEELRMLAAHLHDAIEDRLRETYAIRKTPGRSVLRVRVALTEARRSRPVMDAVSTVVPQARLLSGAKKLATGTHAFVGKAAVEAEVLDARTGAVLIAAVDERAGGKGLGNVNDSWGDVEAAFEHWAERLRVTLAELRVRQP